MEALIGGPRGRFALLTGAAPRRQGPLAGFRVPADFARRLYTVTALSVLLL